MNKNEFLRQKARDLRTNQTDTEALLWNQLRANRLSGIKFKRQQVIGNYIVDFCCSDKMVVIELDGGQHSERLIADRQRDEWLESEGYKVLRFWDNDVITNLPGVLAVILECCG